MGPSRSAGIRHYDTALRLRVSHVIDAATFDPPGMPPSAILVVRRLADPLPRRLMPGPEAVRPAVEWERAVQDRLADYHRRATRPAHGPIGASADAVVFSDQSEMLACLACDLLNGSAAGRWWWRAILRTLPPGAVESLVAAWRRDARYLPAALAFLSARREAVRVLNALSPAQAWNILEDVSTAYGLRLPATSGPTWPGIPARSRELTETDVHHATEQSRAQADAEVRREMSAPWIPRLSADLVPESLGPQRSALLGVSLLLHHTPETVRRRRFAETFFTWYQSAQRRAFEPDIVSRPQASPGVLRETTARVAVLDPAAQSRDIERAAPAAPAIVVPDRASVMPAPASASHEPRSAEARDRNARTADLPPAAQSAAAASRPVDVPGNGLPHEQAPIQIVFEPSSTENRITPTERARTDGVASPDIAGEQTSNAGVLPETRRAACVSEEPLHTELAGVLFLINLLRALHLPASLETEFGVEWTSGWELVELFARCLLGPRRGSLAKDSIWDAVADLAGRPSGVPPGGSFSGRRRYDLPDSWIALAGVARPSTSGMRLRGRHLQLWHPEGFPLADCVFDDLPSHDVIEAERESLAGAGRRAAWTSWRKVDRAPRTGCSPLGVTLGAEMRRFLGFLMPYVRWRLALSLRLRDVRGIADSLLLRRGLLYVTATHVDLVMNLNDASAPVRMAGLDADPGWVPDLGRVVKFDFVQEPFS